MNVKYLIIIFVTLLFSCSEKTETEQFDFTLKYEYAQRMLQQGKFQQAEEAFQVILASTEDVDEIQLASEGLKKIPVVNDSLVFNELMLAENQFNNQEYDAAQILVTSLLYSYPTSIHFERMDSLFSKIKAVRLLEAESLHAEQEKARLAEAEDLRKQEEQNIISTQLAQKWIGRNVFDFQNKYGSLETIVGDGTCGTNNTFWNAYSKSEDITLLSRKKGDIVVWVKAGKLKYCESDGRVFTMKIK
jgi:hypothetical protein